MLFSRVISFLVFSLTLGTFAVGKPVTTRSDVTFVQSVFTSLQSNTNNILPQIKGLTAEGNATNESVGPLIIELISALQGTQGSVALIGPISSNASNDTLVELIAETIADIVGTLDLLANSTDITDLSGLLSGIDLALAEILLGLDVIVAGVITLVATLLAGLTVSLEDIGFGQTITALKL
ncbi:hypothetical protein ACEPAH_1031 [Sanghuangporus vaninii]